MKNSTSLLSIVLSICFSFFLFLSIEAQEYADAPQEPYSLETGALIGSINETIHIWGFSYSAMDRSYESTCTANRPMAEDLGYLSVFIAFDDSEDYAYLPYKEEDIRTLQKGSSKLTYDIDGEGKVKIVIRNPNGGSPWSTLGADQLKLRMYYSTVDISPYQAQGLDLEDEFVFRVLTEQYLDNDLTVW